VDAGTADCRLRTERGAVMIIKAKERGDGRQLGFYLLRDTNEHVELHELRGFIADDLPAALQEIDAISRGTRATNYLFSLSLNPPPKERVPVEDFEAAIEAIEQKMGLEGQPRAIVFHEKDGRRHAHVVWSRIDTEKMRAINLAHYKLKLRDISRYLYLEHGWQMPRGLVNSKERDPANYSVVEWRQAKRGGHDPKALKMMFKECWAISDSRKAFEQALKARGFYLARGDRRGHVAVDYRGEIYAIAQYVDVRTKVVKERLGDPAELNSIEQVKQEIADRMTAKLRQHIHDTELQLQKSNASFEFRKNELIQRQRHQREQLEKSQQARKEQEIKIHIRRFASGMRGLWDRVTGKHARIQRQNEIETLQSFQRDRAEKERLIFSHIDDRHVLHQQIKQMRKLHAEQIAELHRDIAGYTDMASREPPKVQEEIREPKPERQRRPRRSGRRGDFEREI
jgi:hypothetical protein